MEKLDRNSIEEMMADYAFGRLSSNESQIFEASIKDHSDLLDELEEINKVFNRVDELDFNKVMKESSRNVSVKVLNKMNRPKEGLILNFLKLKNVIPTLGLVVISYILLVNNQFDNQKTSYNSEINKTSIIEDSVIVALGNNYSGTDIPEESISFNELISQDINEEILNDFEMDFTDQIDENDIEEFVGSSQYLPLDEILEGLDEDDFQKVIEDMYDEKINI